MATKYVNAAILEARGVGGRQFCAVCFWIWGVIGLFFNTGNFLTATGNVGVGTSAYNSMGMLYWIGGMILFGVGGLLASSGYDFKRPAESAA